jgi:AGCS family alanine or glycine:cation symporter
MSGGPMYTMKKGFNNKRLGAILGWLFALFAVIASFGIGNMTQGNSIASALNTTFHVPTTITGIVITIVALFIIIGGIKSISKVSSVVVPFMAIFYVICGVLVILANIKNLPSGLATIFSMAFSIKAVSGGALGTVVASMMGAMRYGVARGVFSNEAGMGSAAITAAAATTDNPVRQGYINMTGTFWDTIVVCTITGLAIASSGVLGTTNTTATGTYYIADNSRLTISETVNGKEKTLDYDMAVDTANNTVTLTDSKNASIVLTPYDGDADRVASGVETASLASGMNNAPQGTWQGDDKKIYTFRANGTFMLDELVVGSGLTIAAFGTVLGKAGGWLVSIGITLFAFSTILGWEYHGEKAWEYLFGTHKYNMIYRIVFSLMAYVGCTQTLDLVWNFSDIANALMAIPNLICMLLLSGEIAKDIKEFEPELKRIKAGWNDAKTK